MAPRLFLLIAVLFTANLYADTDRDVYDEADGIFKQAEEAVGTNLATFVQANEKPLAKAREEMAELIARVNKEGRSPLATSLQKRLNTLEETVQKRVRTEVPIVVPPKKPLLERMEGKWDMLHCYLVIEKDGSCRQVEKGNGKTVQTGRFILTDPVTAEMKLSPNGWGWISSMPMDEDKLVSFHRNPEGKRQANGTVFERVK